MNEMPPTGRRLIIVDDDAMSREILALLAEDAGFAVQSFDSGISALEFFADLGSGSRLEGMLIDMQMPGISGEPLAQLLCAACGPETTLLAMSASAVSAERRKSFDGFLLKPFTMEQVEAALARHSHVMAGFAASVEALNPAIFEALSQSMPRDQLRKLYAMCLDDAEARIQQMRVAASQRDGDAFRRGAHSIKGGCGMVGATELAGLADRMELAAPEDIGNETTFQEFLDASARLRRILDAP